MLHWDGYIATSSLCFQFTHQSFLVSEVFPMFLVLCFCMLTGRNGQADNVSLQGTYVTRHVMSCHVVIWIYNYDKLMLNTQISLQNWHDCYNRTSARTYDNHFYLTRTYNTIIFIFQVLFPGILLHGSFDFVLMVLGPVSFLYQVADMTLEIVGGVLAVSLTIISTIYAYKTFKKVLIFFFFFNLI